MLLAVSEDRGVESELIPRIATGLCAGMAKSGGVCGAVSGAILALNMLLGRDVPGDPRDDDYAAVRRLLDGFKERCGALDCSELLGCDLGTPEGQALYKEKELSRECERYSAEAAGMAAALLEEYA